MDRLFLDANVLFSAAFKPDARVARFWELRDVLLCTSRYALEEARTNLSTESQKNRLATLAASLQLFDPTAEELPPGVVLPHKDIPILLAAIAAGASHLITGDFQHFGSYFGTKISGILVLTPAEYLRGT